MIANGDTPLCVGIESGSATGWPFTDWVEELVLRQQGIDFYNQWVNHEVPFNDQKVVDTFNEVAGPDGYWKEGRRVLLRRVDRRHRVRRQRDAAGRGQVHDAPPGELLQRLLPRGHRVRRRPRPGEHVLLPGRRGPPGPGRRHQRRGVPRRSRGVEGDGVPRVGRVRQRPPGRPEPSGSAAASPGSSPGTRSADTTQVGPLEQGFIERSRRPTRRRSTPPTRCPPKSGRARSGPTARRSSTATRTPRRPPRTSRPRGPADRLRHGRAERTDPVPVAPSGVTGTVAFARSVGADRSQRGVEHGRRGGQPRVERRRRDAGSRRSRKRGSRGTDAAPRFTVGGVIRLLVFVALAAFLLYYVGPRDIAETALKVALVVVLTAALWVGANLLFDQAYDHWTRFNTIIGVAARLPRLLRRRGERLVPDARRQARCGSSARDCSTTSPAGVTQPFDVNGLLWGLIGGAALGLVMFLLSVPAPAARPASRWRVVGFTGFGLLTALRPRRFGVAGASTGRKLWVCVACGAAVFGLIGLWRYGAARRPAVGPHRRRRRLARRRVGRRRRRRRQLPRRRLRHRRARGDLRRPLRARHRARRPEAAAHRSALPGLDLRHAGAGVHRRRAAGAR